MANHNFQAASFLMRDVYADTCQPHGGQGRARHPSLVNHYDQGHDQLKLCPITGSDQDAAPSIDKQNEAAIIDWRRFDKLLAAFRKQLDAQAAAEENEKALQRQNVKLTVGEDFPLDELTSKEETALFINDRESEVETGETSDNDLISKTDGGPQRDNLEGWTEQSTLEKESGSNTDGEPQVRMKCDPSASFPMRDVYVDTGQPHGGQGGARLLSLPSHDKQNDTGPKPLEFPFQPVHAGRQGWRDCQDPP
ncbi:hypothetical protein ACLB2K_020653 [Fragaria x ananassa]